jgi:Ca2+-binding EF-hand superfamily protein
MGSACCFSKYDHVYDTFPELVGIHAHDYKTLSLAEADVGAVYKIYSVLDVRGSGAIPLPEILAFMQIENSEFTRKIFLSVKVLFQLSEITFFEFLVGCWNFCTLHPSHYHFYIFELYETTKSGMLPISTLKTIIVHFQSHMSLTNFVPQRFVVKCTLILSSLTVGLKAL